VNVYAQHRPGHVDGRGGVVREVAAGVAIGVGQRDPQLHPVQNRCGDRGDLRMTDAGAGCHQGQLAGSHHRVHACAVAMLDLAFEEPADGLQARVRVRRYIHPRSVADVVRPVMVGEAPRPDQRALPLRQDAPHPDGTRAAERDFPRMQQTGECRCLAGYFGWRGIGIAHLTTVALFRHRRADHIEVVVVDPEDVETELVPPALLVLDEAEMLDQRGEPVDAAPNTV
jgi:hypothetical protein